LRTKTIDPWSRNNPKEFIEEAAYYWANRIDNMIMEDFIALNETARK